MIETDIYYAEILEKIAQCFYCPIFMSRQMVFKQKKQNVGKRKIKP